MKLRLEIKTAIFVGSIQSLVKEATCSKDPRTSNVHMLQKGGLVQVALVFLMKYIHPITSLITTTETELCSHSIVTAVLQHRKAMELNQKQL